jgi:hypothetical protein
VLAAALLLVTTTASGCSTLLSADPTPVPGAAATLTRSSRTPIPTPVRSESPSPVGNASPAVARTPASGAASPVAAGRPVTQDEINQLQQTMQRATGSPDLPGMDALLLDRISLSTPTGGQVLDRMQAAAWLREHAGPGISVTRVDSNTQTVLLEVQTDGWPNKDPLSQGRVSFNLRRYNASGRPDEDNGDWKIDVIGAE